MKLPLGTHVVSPNYTISRASSVDVVMLVFKHAVSILVLWAQIISSCALLSNVTAADSSSILSTKTLGTIIPTEFTINRRFALPVRFPPETVYFNIIAALCDVSGGDFESEMSPANYRTTRFQRPMIKIATEGEVEVPRRYIVWGLFLIAFYARANQRFSLAFFVLEWDRKEVAGIGIGDRIPTRKETSFTTASASLPLSALKDDRHLVIQYEYSAGAKAFEQGAMYMTIIGALTTAAPSKLDARITETWISFLNNEPCLFIAVPSLAARTAPPYFIYEDLNLILARTSDFLVEHARYSPLSMNISIDGIQVAKAALTRKPDGHGPALIVVA